MTENTTWNTWRMIPTQRDSFASSKPIYTVCPATPARTYTTHSEAIVQMMIYSPYDSRLTVMEHLQGLFAFLRITDEKVCTRTKEDIYNAVDQVQRYRHREKRSLLGALGDAGQTAETKSLKILESDDCCSDRLDLESDEITWAYIERLEKEVEMFDTNINLQKAETCDVENHNPDTLLVDPTYKSRATLVKNGTVPDAKSNKRNSSKHRKQCDISYAVHIKAKSTDRQYNVKGKSTASIDSKKSVGYAHVVEPIKDLREKLMHKRAINQVTVRKGEKKMSNTDKRSYKTDNIQITVPTEYTDDTLVRKRTVSLIDSDSNDQGRPSTKKLSKTVDKFQFNVPTKDTQCRLKTNVSLVGEKTMVDLTQNVAKHSGKVDNAKIMLATDTNLTPARQSDNACMKVAPEDTQKSLVRKTTVSLQSWLKKTGSGLQSNEKQIDKKDNTQINVQTKDTSSFVGEKTNIDCTQNIAKHSYTVDNDCIKKAVTEVTQSIPIPTITVSMADEKIKRDLTPIVAKHTVDNACTKVVPEVTERNQIAKSTVSLAGEKTTKDLTQEITKQSNEVDKSCLKVAPEVAESNPIPKRTVSMAGEKTTKTKDLTQEIHNDSIGYACSKLAQVVKERNQIPKRTISVTGEKTSKSLTPKPAKQIDKVDNVGIKKVAPEVTKSKSTLNKTVSLAGERANKDLTPKIIKHSDKIDSACAKVTPEVTQSNPMTKTKSLAGEKTTKDLTRGVTKYSDIIDNTCTKVAPERNVIPNKTVSLAGWLKKTEPELQNQSDEKEKVHINFPAKYTLSNSRKAVNMDSQRPKQDLSTRIAEHMGQLNKLKTILSAKETNNLVRKRTHRLADEQTSEESLPKIARQSENSHIKLPTNETVICKKTISLVNVKKNRPEKQSTMKQSDKSDNIQNIKPSKDARTLIRKRTYNITDVKSDGNASPSTDMGSEKKKKFQIKLIKF